MASKHSACKVADVPEGAAKIVLLGGLSVGVFRSTTAITRF